MRQCDNILYRLARFLAGIPPDAAKPLPAVFERSDLLANFGIWAAEAVVGDLFTTLLTLLFTLYVWRRLPSGMRRRLRGVYARFSPTGEIGADDGAFDESESREEDKLLLDEVEVLRARLEAHERRMESMESMDRQRRRQIDRLERELAEARRPWWRRLFGR